jgi:IMP dehydrogenase
MIDTYTFDDILIQPKAVSYVISRKLARVNQTIYGVEFPTPILSASMSVFDTVTPNSRDIYYQFANAIFEAGGTHIFSRATLFENRFRAVQALSSNGIRCGIAVSLREFQTYYDELIELENPALVSIDIANGAIIRNIDWVGNCPLIIGNFGNPKVGAREDLRGPVFLKLGIGSGSGCTTRLVTGVGAPQAWLIKETYDNSSHLIISDGGVKSPADFVKAIALGSDLVMMGSLLAAAKETPWEPVKIQDKWYKPYRGMASAEEKQSNSHVEGAAGYIPYEEKSIKEIISELIDGLTSAMSYSDAYSLDEFRDNVEFLKITNSTANENRIRLLQ